MAKLSAQQLYDLARGAGLTPAASVVAAAVALAESGGDPAAVGDAGLANEKWGPSIGLWQIRSLNADRGTGRARDASRLADPQFNARAMAEVSGAGSNWRPWSVFVSGKYRAHLDTVTTAAGQPAHPRSPSTPSGGTVTNAETNGGLLDGVTDALNPFAVFEGWQDDLQGIAVKLAVAGAALWLVVAGIKSAAGDDE